MITEALFIWGFLKLSLKGRFDEADYDRCIVAIVKYCICASLVCGGAKSGGLELLKDSCY